MTDNNKISFVNCCFSVAMSIERCISLHMAFILKAENNFFGQLLNEIEQDISHKTSNFSRHYFLP